LSSTPRRAPMKSALQDEILPHKPAYSHAFQAGDDRRNRLSHQEIVATREEIKIL
jgi:hypothetical protein